MTTLVQKVVWIADKLISLIILLTIFVVIFFALVEFYELYTDFSELTAERVLHTVALMVVFVKAYRLLLYYLKCHHIGVKYIVEIAVIAPAVELIFAPENHVFGTNLLFAMFSVAMLIVYLLFHERLDEIDERWEKKGETRKKIDI